MKNFFKKMVGLDKLEAKLEQTQQLINETEKKAEEAAKKAEEATQAEALAKMTPKERATARKEPWVAVLDTHVNKENIRNGFFELDWNEYFVLQLKSSGYKGSSDEEIVDAWFSELCRNVGRESGVDMDKRGSGYVNKALRDDGKTEIG